MRCAGSSGWLSSVRQPQSVSLVSALQRHLHQRFGGEARQLATRRGSAADTARPRVLNTCNTAARCVSSRPSRRSARRNGSSRAFSRTQRLRHPAPRCRGWIQQLRLVQREVDRFRHRARERPPARHRAKASAFQHVHRQAGPQPRWTASRRCVMQLHPHYRKDPTTRRSAGLPLRVSVVLSTTSTICI